jgi:hypothetical protein
VGSKSDALEADILKAVTGQTPTILATLPLTNVYLALFTATPSDSGGGTEVSTSGTAYARQQTVGKWGAPSGTTQVATNATITFPTATADWGVITSFGLFTASSAGTLMYWGALGASKTVSNGDTASVASGGLILTED